ncbi:unnamed protein product [Nesidiocoris tenuis]|uniref:Uncharacterized protein n=1 Tax=Nesidiocoris tenuis TaxID=355587 RepID=A0A6H5HCA5_9HEMI|nr:unnamed protein product [Nesidiocoris tenuis]
MTPAMNRNVRTSKKATTAGSEVEDSEIGEKLSRIDSELISFYEFCEQMGFTPKEMEDICSPLHDLMDKKSCKKIFKMALFSVLVVLGLYASCQLTLATVHASALGRIALIKTCETVDSIHVLSNLDYEMLVENYLNRDIPLIVVDAMDQWPVMLTDEFYFDNITDVSHTQSFKNWGGCDTGGTVVTVQALPHKGGRAGLATRVKLATTQQRCPAITKLGARSDDAPDRPNCLWNIIQDASVVRGEDALTKFSAKYSSQLEKYDPSVDETEFLRQLEQITQLLENSDPKALLAFQDYAASKRVDRIVLEIARHKESTSSILEPSLGFIALCYKGAASLIAGRLTTNNEDELIPALKLITALCRDDDVRVEASSAHVHATELAEHLLKPCLSILKGLTLAVFCLFSPIWSLVDASQAGVIDVMNEMLGDKTDCRTVDDCKSVLVALNAPVELQSRWTGERGDIVALRTFTVSGRRTQDDVTAIKVMTHSKTTAIVYRLNVAPIFFEVEGVIYPTAYTLWQHPRLLPAFVTFEAVIDILANGADLMLPGVSDVIFAGGEGQATVREGEPVNICTKENAACAAVGQSLVNDSGGAIRQSQTGKAVRVLHVCGDHLLLQLMDCVPHRPIISHQAYSEPQDQQSSIGDGSPLTGGASSAGASTDEPSGEENTIPAESVDVLITQLEQVQTEDTDQNTAIEPDMNDIADYCLLEGLCQKKLTLPILANLFYKNFMLVQVPPGLELNIKKTKYKKLSVMLKEMSAVKLLEFVDDKGVQSITKIDSSHALFRELRTSTRFEELMRRKKSAPNQEAVANDNDSSLVSWERPVEIREDLIVNKVVSKVFEPYGFKHRYYVGHEGILCRAYPPWCSRRRRGHQPAMTIR